MDIALKKVRPSHLLLVLALALVAASSQAAAFMPILHNFGKKVYGGALQNWDVTQGKNGENMWATPLACSASMATPGNSPLCLAVAWCAR